jgi:hypothetical protein
MEEVYSRVKNFTEPAVYSCEVGRGRVVYFPWDIDRTFWDVLDVDHGKLLKNSVLWATAEQAPVSVKGAGVLDIAVWKQKNSMTVHLVNLTNPMMMKGPIREIFPVPAQQLSVQLPKDQRIGKVHLLVAGKEVPFTQHADRIELEVPSIALHEIVAVDFT